MPEKLRLLAWGDCSCPTGFSNVTEHVLRSLYDTGRYDIDVLAINYQGQFADKEKYPYQLVPARLQDPKDPYGLKMFVRALRDKRYDVVWIVNDTFVVDPVSKAIQELRNKCDGLKQKPPFFVYYYPVDCRVIKDRSNMLEVADLPVAYTKFGIDETLKVFPNLKNKLRYIYHGVDSDVFRPLSEKEREACRRKYFGVSDDTFILVNINRNSIRKQLPLSILSFSQLRKSVPRSILYLHTNPRERMSGLDLFLALDHLGLSHKKDVLFPAGLDMAKGYPVEILNEYYNCADCVLTTTGGEGFGLINYEALAAGVPLVAPDNTVHPEILENGKCGILYPCKNISFAENSGYRAYGLPEDIVDAVLKAKNMGPEERGQLLANGRECAAANDWKKIGEQWVRLIGEEYGKFLTEKPVRGIKGDIL